MIVEKDKKILNGKLNNECISNGIISGNEEQVTVNKRKSVEVEFVCHNILLM